MGLKDLVDRYRAELRALVLKRRRLDALIAAKREVIDDLLAEAEDGALVDPPPPRRGRITQEEAVRRILAPEGVNLTAAEVYAAALEIGAGGSERSLRNILSRGVKSGDLVVDRREFPQRYRLARSG